MPVLMSLEYYHNREIYAQKNNYHSYDLKTYIEGFRAR